MRELYSLFRKRVLIDIIYDSCSFFAINGEVYIKCKSLSLSQRP